MSVAKVNLAAKLGSFSDAWNPRVIGDINDCQVKLAIFRGAFDAHLHAQEDEMFLVISGNLRLVFADSTVELSPGELCIVPRGVLHQPVALPEAQVLLVEPASTLNTGNLLSRRTRHTLERI